MDTMTSILGRRSIRKYKPDPVKDQDLAQLLEAIRWAPSWVNFQPWEVVVVRDPEVKKKLQGTMPKGNPATEAIVAAPVVIAMCGSWNKSGMYKGKFTTDLGDWMMFDLGIACQNLCLAAHALGLGTVHVGYLNHKEVNEILGLPDDVTALELIPVGYPDKESKPPPRRQISEFVSHDKYGHRA